MKSHILKLLALIMFSVLSGCATTHENSQYDTTNMPNNNLNAPSNAPMENAHKMISY